MDISRRTFLIGGIASTPLLAAVGWSFGSWAGMDRRLIMAVVGMDLSYLQIEPSILLKFADDHIEHGRPIRVGQRLRYLYFILTGSKQDTIYGDRRFAAVSSQFLLSSDFFWNGENEKKPVEYLGYYDPYRRVCSNPFARFDA